MLGALAYIVSPIDIVPELFLGLFGLADDVVVAGWLAGAFLAETERFLSWRIKQAAASGSVIDGETG